MAEIRKANAGDYGLVLDLLLSLGGAGISAERWRQLFINHWNAEENYFGYILLDKGVAVGFLGMIFSRRYFGAQQRRICNLTSWVVKEEYRTESLKLLAPLAQMKDYLVTNFTAQKKVSFILQKFGFIEIDNCWVIIPPLPAFPALHLKRSYIIKQEEIEKILNGRDLEVFKDHLKFNCKHAVIMCGGYYCYIVFHKVTKKGLPFAQIDYVSDIESFHQNLAYIRNRVIFHAKAIGMLVERRFLRNQRPPVSFRYMMPHPSPKLAANVQDMVPALIDSLYSELIVLGM